MCKKLSLRFITILLMTLFVTSVATGQTPTVTYQGMLNDNGGPANGNYELRFTIYDAPTGGNALGIMTNAPTLVSNGLFTVPLEFEASVFNGEARWLDIGVRTNGDTGLFISLNPRQPVTSAPYAIQAANASTAVSAAIANSANSVAAANINGTIPLAQLPSSLITNGSTGVNLTGAFTGSGLGITDLLLTSLRSFNPSPVKLWGNTYTPTNVPAGLTNIVRISRGVFVTSAIRSDGSVVVWGTPIPTLTNIPPGLTNVVALTDNACTHVLSLKSDGTVVAWGENPHNVTNVPPGLIATAIGSGFYHNLAVKTDGTVVAWGDNGSGQINVPAGLSNVVAVSGASSTSMALKNDGTVVVWGAGSSTYLKPPDGLNNVVKIACGYSHALALKSDGTVVGWGYDSQYNEEIVPPGLSDVVAIAAAETISVALKRDGTMITWGRNIGAPVGFKATQIAAGGLGIMALESALSSPSLILDGNTNVTLQGSFTGTGSGLTNLNASSLTSGTINDLRLSANVSLLGASIDLGTAEATGTLADARLSTNVPVKNGTNVFTGTNWFDGVVIATNANNHIAGTFTGNGIGLTNLKNLDASQLISGTLPLAQLPSLVVTNGAIGVNIDGNISGTFTGNGSALTNLPLSSLQTLPLTNGQSNVSMSGSFSGNGSSLTNLNASSLINGTVNDARLSTNVALLTATNVFVGTNRFAGVALATNVNNQFVGAFTGNGSGLTNLPLTGLQVLPVTNNQSNVTLAGALSGSFTGNGSSLTNLNASGLINGTVNDARLSANIPRLNAANTFTGPNNFSGNVGIGTSANSIPFSVAGDAKVSRSFGVGPATPDWAEGRFHISGSVGELSIGDRAAGTNFHNVPSNGQRYIWYVDAGKMRLWSGTDKLSIATNGVLTLSNAPTSFSIMPGYNQNTAQTGYVTLDIPNASTLVVWDSFEVTGTASKPGGGSWNASSDRRLKDVGANFTRGLDAVTSLQPIFYHYKKDNSRGLPHEPEYIGLIAQEVQKVIPEAVSTDDKGFLAVNNDPIIWAMLNAIKELNAENSSLKKQIVSQRQMNEKMEERLTVLERAMEGIVRSPNVAAMKSK